MPTFKYKILEFTPDQKMEKAFNDLGKEGWELVSVTPIGLKVEGYTDTTLWYGGERAVGSSRRLRRILRSRYNDVAYKRLSFGTPNHNINIVQYKYCFYLCEKI